MKAEELVRLAGKAKEKAYVPYSKFHVGAVLVTESGDIYEGCNIENASYPLTNCAERTAFFKAISEGERSFRAIAIVGDKNPCYPCGACRQVMAEFCDKDFEIILSGDDGVKVFKLSELLPYSFEL
mgnify:FL=1